MKILFIINSLNYGGAEVQLVRIINSLVEANNKLKIELLLLLPSKSSILESKLNKIKIYKFNLKKNPLSVFSIFRIIKTSKADIVHSHMYYSNIIARLAKIFNNKLIIINTVHGIEEFSLIRRLFYSVFKRFANLTLLVGERLLKIYRIIDENEKKSRVLYNGLNLNLYQYSSNDRRKARSILNIDDNDFVFINVGRLTKVKNQLNLILSFANLDPKFINTKLIIIGDGDLFDKFNAIIKQKNLSNKVLLIGFSENVNMFLSSADAFILTSNKEGLPLVLQEACANGLPIITTNVGSTFEFINNNGYLIENNTNEITQSMNKILSLSCDELKEMRKNSLLISKKFNLSIIISELTQIYNTFLTIE